MKAFRQVRTLATAAAVACLGLGCAGTIPPPQHFKDMERTAGEGQSEIIVYRIKTVIGSAAKARIFIDNKERLRVGNGKTETIVVPDGKHSIYANNHFTKKTATGKENTITVNIAGSRIIFNASAGKTINPKTGKPFPMTGGGTSLWRWPLKTYIAINLADGSEIPLSEIEDWGDDNTAPMPKPTAVAVSNQDLPKIAVYVTGDVKNNEKEALGTRMLTSLVKSGRYIAIERSNAFLAEIEKEHVKQRSGDIDDSQISQLGRQFGVKFVCIAAITPAFGDFQVSARIVDVETAQVVFIGESSGQLKSMADLTRISDQVVKNMSLGGGR